MKRGAHHHRLLPIGSEGGAFTDPARAARFKLATCGTLFLDERGVGASANTAQRLREMASRISQAGFTMELEVFDFGDVRLPAS